MQRLILTSNFPFSFHQVVVFIDVCIPSLFTKLLIHYFICLLSVRWNSWNSVYGIETMYIAVSCSQGAYIIMEEIDNKINKYVI